jgi:predicted TIM-barrel enzyme
MALSSLELVQVGTPPGNSIRELKPTTKPTGIGLSAKAVEQGGCDLILIYNSGRFRMAGRGSLAGLMPYSDANKVVVEMVRSDQPNRLI